MAFSHKHWYSKGSNMCDTRIDTPSTKNSKNAQKQNRA